MPLLPFNCKSNINVKSAQHKFMPRKIHSLLESISMLRSSDGDHNLFDHGLLFSFITGWWCYTQAFFLYTWPNICIL